MVELHSVPPNGNEIKCANCGGNIIEHIEITFISCLSALSGEIEVYRDHNAESTKGNESKKSAELIVKVMREMKVFG